MNIVSNALPFASGKQKIGLLGGSFDPPHLGHIRLSKLALQNLGLDWVWWCITPHNPLKKHQPSSLQSRFRLCEKLIKQNRVKIKPTIFEGNFVNHNKKSHTVNFLQVLKQRRANNSFVWLMGEDNVGNFHHWHGWQKIVNMIPIAIISRPPKTKLTAAKFSIRFANDRIDTSDGTRLWRCVPPAWIYLDGLQCQLSSSAARYND